MKRKHQVIKIIDNYLPDSEHLKLKEVIESNNFPWFYNDGKVSPSDRLFDYQFFHNFYKDNNVSSELFYLLNPIIEKIKPLSLIRIKANCNPISHKLVVFDKHVDQFFNSKAAVYYVNDNNGYTMIGDKKIISKSNRIVFFDADTKHYGTNSTNYNNRIVINFNYF